jgi:hypothetical protein
MASIQFIELPIEDSDGGKFAKPYVLLVDAVPELGDFLDGIRKAAEASKSQRIGFFVGNQEMADAVVAQLAEHARTLDDERR